MLNECIERSEVYRFFKAPLNNSVRLGHESRQSSIYEKFLSKTLICKLGFGTSSTITHGRGDLRPAHKHLFRPKIHLELVPGNEAVLLMGKTNPHWSSREGQERVSLQMAEEHLSIPRPSCCGETCSCKAISDGPGEMWGEVMAPFKGRHRSEGVRGKEKCATEVASTRRERPVATNYLAM